MVYRYFRDTKHDSRAAMESARDFVNYLSQQHSQYQAIAEEAIASGDMDGALKAAVKSWNSIPDGADISVDKEHNGFRVTYKDAKGAVVHEALMTPDQIAAQILGMTPKTYWDQIVSAAGGHQPSKEFSAALEKLNRTGTITSEELAKVRDSKEVRFLVKHEEDLHTVRAGQDAEEKAASEKTRREVSAEINKAYAKNKTLPTRDQLAGADDATRNIFTPLLDKADKEVDKNSHKATLQKAFDEYNTTGHVSSATAVDVAAIDGGQEALDKFISENEAADKAKRDAANADRAAAGENRAAADAALKESQMPGGPPTTQETNDSGVAEAATGVVGKIEAAVPDRSVVVFDPPAAARVNDLVTNIWAWNRTRIQGAAPVADFVGQYLAMPNPDFAYAVRVNGPNTTVQSLNDGMMWVMPNGAYTQLKQLNGKVAATNTAEAAHKREQAQPPPTAPAGNVVDPYTNPSVTSRLPPPEARPSTAGPAVAPPVPFNPDPMHRRMPPRPAGP
jgi:hypothetical protein